MKNVVEENIIKIDNEYIPNPSSKGFTISYDDADYDTGRAESGLLYRNCLGYTRKLQLSFPPLNNAQASKLLKAVRTTPNRAFFNVTFPDALEGGEVTREMYVGGRTTPAYYYDEETQEILWNGIAFNLITRDVDKV